MTDAPAVNFSDELLKAYPDARVVLTNRAPEKWLHSIFQTYHRALLAQSFRIAAIVDPVRIPPRLSISYKPLLTETRDWVYYQKFSILCSMIGQEAIGEVAKSSWKVT